MKGMSRTAHLPPELEAEPVNGAVADVRGCNQIICVLSEHLHAVVRQRGEYSAACEMRMNCYQIVVDDVKPVLCFKCGRFFPCRVTHNPAANFSDHYPICPAAKRRVRPFAVNIPGCARRHSRVSVISAKMILECSFGDLE